MSKKKDDLNLKGPMFFAAAELLRPQGKLNSRRPCRYSPSECSGSFSL